MVGSPRRVRLDSLTVDHGEREYTVNSGNPSAESYGGSYRVGGECSVGRTRNTPVLDLQDPAGVSTQDGTVPLLSTHASTTSPLAPLGSAGTTCTTTPSLLARGRDRQRPGASGVHDITLLHDHDITLLRVDKVQKIK